MSAEKSKSKLPIYVGSFLVGGALCSLSHLFTLIYRQLGVPEIIVISVTVYTLAALGSIAAVLGWYGHLVRLGGMGAMVTMCGFSSAITDAVADARRRKNSFGKTIYLGVIDGLKILGSAYLLTVVIVVILTLVQ